MGNKIYESSVLQKYSTRSWNVKSPRMCCRELPGTGGDRSPTENVCGFSSVGFCCAWSVREVLFCGLGVFLFVFPVAGWLEYGKGEIMAIFKKKLIIFHF